MTAIIEDLCVFLSTIWTSTTEVIRLISCRMLTKVEAQSKVYYLSKYIYIYIYIYIIVVKI